MNIKINSKTLQVPEGVSLAAALQIAGVSVYRHSVGQPATSALDGPNQTDSARGEEGRGPLCGMGICHECRVKLGTPGCKSASGGADQMGRGKIVRSCMVWCEEGMEVYTL